MLIIFECEPEQIAYKASEINENTKAFVGLLEPGIFGQIKKYNIEQVFTKFPERKIRFDTVEIGGKSKEELKQSLADNGINISEYASSMMDNPEFTTLREAKDFETVKISVADLGFRYMATTKEIYQRAEELGLELCPAEVGPHLRLKDKSQQMDDWYWVAMKQITDSYGSPHVFRLWRDGDELWLDDRWTNPGNKWYPDYQLVFRYSK
jgi:hypothetical protein